MKAWKEYALPAIVLFVILGFYWWLGKPDKGIRSTKQVFSPITAATPYQNPTPALNLPIQQEYPQISLKGKSRDEAIREYLLHQEKDDMYDWKIPIRFYGKVIDQYNQPVAGATVRLQWVNRQGTEARPEA